MNPAVWVLVALAQPTPGGRVVLPADDWDRMVEAAREQPLPKPPLEFAPIDRRLEGEFRRGLFRGTLTARFEVFSDHQHVRVPVVDGSVSLGPVQLDGKRTSVLREGDFYTVGVESQGRHEVKVEVFAGREQDRFTRRIDLLLPGGGPTRFRALIPETGIEPSVENGAFDGIRTLGAATEIVGNLGASGRLALSWNRTLRHEASAAVRSEARLLSIVTVQEALAEGLAQFSVRVLEGEADRFDLQLPAGLEVSSVEGPAVLQWRTEAKTGKLLVLLRHLVTEEATFLVRFQFPIDGQGLVVRLPWMAGDAPVTGALGVVTPAGLDVRTTGEIKNAETLSVRDVPPDLAELASSPLLLAFGFTEPPEIHLSLGRHEEVELSSTIVDELQASTVLIESGVEITKLKLRVRNNTRQYLTLTLPPGAVLTHSLIDGSPVRPALASNGAKATGEQLLLPLRQSERIGEGRERTHVVRPGETLSGIANTYYSDPAGFERIRNANPELMDAELQAGQSLTIPPKSGNLEESSFVVELAYRRSIDPIGSLGRRTLNLPELDVETVVAVWHVYFPEVITPLGIDANLTQYSQLRYDPFRRARMYLDQALSVRSAWAGSASYKSIFSQRKAIWQAENEQKSGDELVLSTFPLTGEKIRFKRILMGRETPTISYYFVRRGFAGPMQGLGLLLSFAVVLQLLRAPMISRTRWVAVVVVALIMLGCAHHFLGMHKRILWGIDLALLVTAARPMAARVWVRIREISWSPWRVGELLTLRNIVYLGLIEGVLGLVVLFPLLLSSIGLLVLLVVVARMKRMEASHV